MRGVGLILLIGGIAWTVIAIVWSRMRKPPPPPFDPGIPQLTEHQPVTAPVAQRDPIQERPDWMTPESASPQQDSVPCINCGRPVPVEFRFCDGCGTPLR